MEIKSLRRMERNSKYDDAEGFFKLVWCSDTVSAVKCNPEVLQASLNEVLLVPLIFMGIRPSLPFKMILDPVQTPGMYVTQRGFWLLTFILTSVYAQIRRHPSLTPALVLVSRDCIGTGAIARD